MVGYTPHSPGPGGVPTQGCVTDHGEASPTDIGCEMGLPSAVEGNGGSEVLINGGVCAEETE